MADAVCESGFLLIPAQVLRPSGLLAFGQSQRDYSTACIRGRSHKRILRFRFVYIYTCSNHGIAFSGAAVGLPPVARRLRVALSSSVCVVVVVIVKYSRATVYGLPE